MRRISVVIIMFLVVVTLSCSSPVSIKSLKNTGYLPVAGEYPGLIPAGKRKSFILEDDRNEYLGANAAVFNNYELLDFYHNEYTLNGDTNYMSIESYLMSGENSAAGVFYYFVRRKLRNKGEHVDVGADGVVDVLHEGRNLYFFKGRWFFSLIYSGKGEVPDMLPIARMMAKNVPGNDWKPDGFRYLEVNGISSKYAYVTAGNAMNFAFLPPSVTTFVSSAGLEANIYVSNFHETKEAGKASDEFVGLLRTGLDYKKTPLVVNGIKLQVYSAVDEKEGLLMFAQYRKAIVAISHVENRVIATELIKRVFTRVLSDYGVE